MSHCFNIKKSTVRPVGCFSNIRSQGLKGLRGGGCLHTSWIVVRLWSGMSGRETCFIGSLVLSLVTFFGWLTILLLKVERFVVVRK